MIKIIFAYLWKIMKPIGIVERVVSVMAIIPLILIIACNQRKSHDQTDPIIPEQGEMKSEIITEEYQTKSGKRFIVAGDHSRGASLVKVSIETRDFEIVNDVYQLGEIDPVENIFLADLDNDGFEELYITTRSAGSGSYSSIYGFASNKDKSVSQIYVSPVENLSREKAEFYVGFMGHNTYKLEEGVLVNEFPVYLEGDTNAEPNGGKRKIYYDLISGEASRILSPERVESFDK